MFKTLRTDFVDIVIHSYRHRYGAVPGDPQLDLIEQRLSGQPRIHVPAILLHGESDGVHPAERSESHEKFFSGYYERRLIPRAGHLLPREAPDAVLAAVRKLDRLLNEAR
jgi:pimeloyl-ACP methyl ester carboxylesterase